MSSFTANNKQNGASRLVESHSVQGQFAALTRDRDRLRREVDSADRQRRQQEGLLAELRALQASLSQQLQTAHASLGAFQKQKALVEHEKARLSTLLETERKELLEAQDKLQLLLETQKQSKESYLQQMHEWNDELEQLLCQAEEKEWKRCISTKTIAMIPQNVVDMTDAKALWDEAIHKKHDAEEMQKKLLHELDQLRSHAQKQQVCSSL